MKGGVVPTAKPESGLTGTPAAAKATTTAQKPEGDNNNLIIATVVLVVIAGILLGLYRQKRR